MFKSINKKWLIFFPLCLFLIVFHENIYNLFIYYESERQRNIYSISDKKFIDFVLSNSDQLSEPEVKQIIKTSLSLTAEHMCFTTENCTSEPLNLFITKKANCIGYAAFFSSACNILLKKFNLSKSWSVKHHVGHIYFLGVDIHPYFDSPFFKDHDFVSIENKLTGEVYAVDPTVKDYLFIDFIDYKK